MAAWLCALLASLTVAVAPAAAEEGNSAPLRSLSDGGFIIPAITGPSFPEEYPFRVDLGEDQELRQVDEGEVAVVYSYGPLSFDLHAPPEHDIEGATVPTTIRVTEEGVVTVFVHHRAGNPAAAGAPFAYPVVGGTGWTGGFHTIGVEMDEPPAPTVEPPIGCTVPALRHLSLRAVKARLRAANCSVGAVHLAGDATAAEGKVVKQFRAAGTELAAGAPVAVKLGSR